MSTPVGLLMNMVLYRMSATERARSFIYTPPTKPVNVHQFYATLVNEYEVQVNGSQILARISNLNRLAQFAVFFLHKRFVNVSLQTIWWLSFFRSCASKMLDQCTVLA